MERLPRPFLLLAALAMLAVLAYAVWYQADAVRVPRMSGAPHFDPDRETDTINADQLAARFGPLRKSRKPYRIGAIMKFLGNNYWQLLADGMSAKVNELGVTIDIRSAASESDEAGQLNNMQSMVELDYDAILISPQTNTNLIPAVKAARKKGILVLTVDDAVLDDAEHYVGPNQYENGVHAAHYFNQRFPNGGEVALIRGVNNSYAVMQRSQGFIDTLKKANNTSFQLVADVSAEWDLQTALAVSARILKAHPTLRGFYCNNDIMALGVVQSVKNAGLSKQTIVIGTDGITPAMDAIRAGELTATVDSLPYQTGIVAIEVALRLLDGQKLPRVVYSPQQLVTRESLAVQKIP